MFNALIQGRIEAQEGDVESDSNSDPAYLYDPACDASNFIRYPRKRYKEDVDSSPEYAYPGWNEC